MEKKSKIQSTGQSRQWKDIWFHDVVMENGDQGQVRHNTSNGSELVGKELTYTLEKNKKNGWNIVPVKSKKQVNDQAVGMMVGNALTNAVTLVVAGKTGDDLEGTARKICQISEKLKQEFGG